MAERTFEEETAEVQFLSEPPDGSVLRFRKRFGEVAFEYTYAAVRAGDLWYVTGARSPQGLEWQELMVWLYGTGPMPVLEFAGSWSALQ